MLTPAQLRPTVPAAPPHTNRMETNVLWTILIVLAIIALAIWILTRVRGGRV